MGRLHLVNALVCGHVIVAAALVLNVVHAREGIPVGVLGVAFAVAALTAAWLASSMRGEGLSAREGAWATSRTEALLYRGERIGLLPPLFTALAWACYLVPALLR